MSTFFVPFFVLFLIEGWLGINEVSAQESLSAEQLQGRFQVSGTSFDGRIPGDITYADNGAFQLRLLRPSGLSLMSLTYTGPDAKQELLCARFDVDGIQYQGSIEDFNRLTQNLVSPSQLNTLFHPNNTPDITNWTWVYNNKERKLKVLEIGNDTPLLSVQYRQWKRGYPSHFFVHLHQNDWKMKANINKRQEVQWSFSCELEEGIVQKPLTDMLLVLPQNP